MEKKGYNCLVFPIINVCLKISIIFNKKSETISKLQEQFLSKYFREAAKIPTYAVGSD